MNSTDKQIKFAQIVNARCRESASWYAATTGDLPFWWGSLLSSIVLLIGDKDEGEIKYVSALNTEDSFKVVLLTSTQILVGVATGTSGTDVEQSVSVYSRSKIESLSLSVTGSITGRRDFDDWVGKPSVTLAHSSVGELRLPLDTPMVQQNYTDLLAFALEAKDSIQ